MSGDPMNSTPPPRAPDADSLPAVPPAEDTLRGREFLEPRPSGSGSLLSKAPLPDGRGSSLSQPLRVDSPQVVLPHARVKELHPLWVTWFAHPFANWFWFYFGFVAALSGSNMKYPSLGPVIIVSWLTGHLVNAKHPWGEIKLLLASMGMGYVCDSIITLMGVLKFHEPTTWWCPIPLWMAMMWPNFAATLNSSMKWLRGRYQLGAIMGAIAGPFSYYGGVKWGSVDLGWGFWPAMIVIGVEWALAMPTLLWLSARWVPEAEVRGQGAGVSQA